MNLYKLNKMVRIVVKKASDHSLIKNSNTNSLIDNENKNFFGINDDDKMEDESGTKRDITFKKDARLRKISRIFMDMSVVNISGEASQIIVETSIISQGMMLKEEK